MAKSRLQTVYMCDSCGASYSKWLGRCLQCQALNTVVEKNIAKASLRQEVGDERSPVRLGDVEAEVPQLAKHSMQISFLDQLLQEGLPEGTVVLLAGEPGIGKSTLLFQLLASQEGPSLYVSAEESIAQISRRFRSLSPELPRELFIVSENQIDAIRQHMHKLKPRWMVVDSIQMLMGSEDRIKGGMATLREVAEQLVEEAKQIGTILWIVGHVNKEGDIAGPKTLEHLVDTVLIFSLAEDSRLRILQVQKNRYGPSGEMVLLEMSDKGLKEKPEGDSYWIRPHAQDVSGCAISSIVIGSRILLVEIQALVVDSYFPSPRRSTSGFDLNRLFLLLAVLEKRLKLPFSKSDVYLNVVGGLKISDPAADLAVAAALVSALTETPVSATSVFCSEVGLTGELRSVGNIEDRIRAAANLGKKRFVTAPIPNRQLSLKGNLSLSLVESVGEALSIVLN